LGHHFHVVPGDSFTPRQAVTDRHSCNCRTRARWTDRKSGAADFVADGEETPGVDHAIGMFRSLGAGLRQFEQLRRCCLYRSNPFDERNRPKNLSAARNRRSAQKKCSAIQDCGGDIAPCAAAVQGVGTIGRIQEFLQDRGAHGYDEARTGQGGSGLNRRGQPATSSIHMPVFDVSEQRPQLSCTRTWDRVQGKKHKACASNVFEPLQAYWFRLYNDFNRFGRNLSSDDQAEPQFRNPPEDIAKLEDAQLERRLMAAHGCGGDVHLESGPTELSHYNV